MTRPSPLVVSSLERRMPGETDLRMFTTELIRAGRHRVRPGGVGYGTVRSKAAATAVRVAVGC